MNNIAKTSVFLVVLVSDWLYSLTWAETLNPLDCYDWSVPSCDAYIYLRNVTEPINSVAIRFNISTLQIVPFDEADYLAKITCSCVVFSKVEAYFYRVNYTVQASDVGLMESEISDKYFGYTAWTEKSSNSTYKTGENIELVLGCGCPVRGWDSIVSYAIPVDQNFRQMSTTFNSNLDEIMNLNKMQNPDVLVADRVYFIPYDYQTVAAVLLLLFSIVSFYYTCYKRAPSPQSSTAIKNGQPDYSVAQMSEIITINGTKRNQEQREKMDDALSVPTLTNLTHDEIVQMESYCTQCYEIGEGSFGSVYMGNLKEKEVAIKKIKYTGKYNKKLIENEVKLLDGKKHKNLVSLIAWYIEENAFYVVYEYVNGCNLDKYLRENCERISLCWEQCMRIITSIAEGIEFLHLNKIIHVDIKPQNLMVDSKDKEVKLIDFGFSRHVDWEGTHRSTDRITGTRGYWAPEYCLNHKLSYKHDVYSFGIVVLEVITGQKHVDDARGSSQFHIPDYVRYMIACNRFKEALDERFKTEGFSDFDLMNALAVANLALKCAELDKEERPDMSYVVRVLNKMDK
ncbi:hypothetical protein SUGI_0859560 [Cryptomeria japonica]|nr:hypothetical protein SUGI_0859560 [Cryptomeria japonica]